MFKRLPIIASVIFILSCSHTRDVPQDRDFRANMRDAQKLSSELFSFVWNKESFESKENETKIRSLLSEIGKDFHEIQKAGSSLELEPGFHVVIKTQRELLNDISNRFKQGNKDYALWRLKGMTQNCIACHSRLNVPYDFIGNVEAKGVEGQFAEAEFLFASRKFDLASAKFLELASKKQVANNDDSFLALKYWILIELRVKGRFDNIKKTLNQFATSKSFNKEHREIIKHWLVDLNNVEEMKVDSLLGIPEMLYTENDIEMEYVTTVAETSTLHSLLDANPLTTKRKRALLNLGSRYLNLSLPSLSVFGPMYLEQTIREFPKTLEAKTAYRIYKSKMELEFTGSGGVNLDQDQEKKLKKLKRMAG